MAKATPFITRKAWAEPMESVAALIDAYAAETSKLFAGTGDASGAAALYIYPYNNFTFGSHTQPPDAAAAIQNGDWYFGLFRKRGVASRTLVAQELRPVGPAFQLAVLHWQCLDAAGNILLDYETAHGCRATNDGWRIEFAVHDDETRAVMERFPDFMEEVMASRPATT